jgi:hypothetical protein
MLCGKGPFLKLLLVATPVVVCGLACPPGGVPPPSCPAAPTALTACSPYGFTTTLPTAARCFFPADSHQGLICLVDQSATGSVSVAVDPGGFPDTVAVCIPDGRAKFSTVPQNPGGVCATSAPHVGSFDATFTVSYWADYRRSSPVCIVSSRADFTSFSITGSGHIDDALRQAAENDILHSMDATIAAILNTVVNGAAATPPSEPRCAGWSLVPSPAPTATPVPTPSP